MPSVFGCGDLHLEVSDKPLHGNSMFDLQEKTVAAQNHALQDVQGHLLNGRVGRLAVDEAGDLKEKEVRLSLGEGGQMWQNTNRAVKKLRYLLDEDWWKVLPRYYPMIHQLHETCQRVGHDHGAPGNSTDTYEQVYVL